MIRRLGILAVTVILFALAAAYFFMRSSKPTGADGLSPYDMLKVTGKVSQNGEAGYEPRWDYSNYGFHTFHTLVGTLEGQMSLIWLGKEAQLDTTGTSYHTWGLLRTERGVLKLTGDLDVLQNGDIVVYMKAVGGERYFQGASGGIAMAWKWKDRSGMYNGDLLIKRIEQ